MAATCHVVVCRMMYTERNISIHDQYRQRPVLDPLARAVYKLLGSLRGTRMHPDLHIHFLRSGSLSDQGHPMVKALLSRQKTLSVHVL